jgi:hypothetical protein
LPNIENVRRAAIGSDIERKILNVQTLLKEDYEVKMWSQDPDSVEGFTLP